MLGSASEADDAVQECWLRLSRSDRSDVENLGGFLTTVVARTCLDMLRARTSRRETLVGEQAPEATVAVDPEQEAVLADSVGPALLVVLETLAPAERLAFVLHDMFAVPFDEIAGMVGRSPAAARQLASRARRRVQGADPDAAPGVSDAADRARQRQVVEAFLAAARGGDFGALLALLAPDVVLRSDAAAVQVGSPAELRGPAAVAETFAGRARAAQLAVIDGAVGLVWAQGGKPRVVFDLTVAGRVIAAVEILADPERLAQLEIEMLGA